MIKKSSQYIKMCTVERFRENYIQGKKFWRRVNETLFLEALQELDSMIAMDTLTKSVLGMVTYFLTRPAKSPRTMSNLLISGPPGSGKTTVATIIAKLLHAVENPGNPTPPTPSVTTRSRGIRKRAPRKGRLTRRKPPVRKATRRQKSPDTPPSMNPLFGLLALSILSKDDDDSPSPQSPPSKLPYVIGSRVDFVGGYVGQSAIKTTKFLEANKNKVIIVDEAYSLVLGRDDEYGNEVLAELVKFMSTNPQTIFIFCGYRDKIEENLFVTQPGLKRRFLWYFEMDPQTPSGLNQLFALKADPVPLEEDFTSFFRTNKEWFEAGGGDIEKLVMQCRIVMSQTFFETRVKPKSITAACLQTAFEIYRSNIRGRKTSLPPPGMYN